MTRSIGELLEDPWDFFRSLDHVSNQIAVLNAAMEATLFDHLGDEPATVEALAGPCGLAADKLARLINFLVAEEVLALHPDGRVAHTPHSRRLPEVASVIYIEATTGKIGGSLYRALQEGVSAYEMSYGKPIFEHLASHPGEAAKFVDFMGFLSRRVEQFILTQHAFRPFTRAVDVGGSHGELLLGLLARHGDARGVLFDLPETVAQVADTVRASEHGDRVELVGGDFLRLAPGGDLYLIKQILHDWSDEHCVAILKSVRAAIEPGGRIAVIEHVLPERPAMTDAQTMDIAMMVWATGRERKLSEIQALFVAAGFAFDRITHNPHGQSVIEAVPT